ncbi:hypothetical protein D3C86_1743890 [compost metagenome]
MADTVVPGHAAVGPQRAQFLNQRPLNGDDGNATNHVITGILLSCFAGKTVVFSQPVRGQGIDARYPEAVHHGSHDDFGFLWVQRQRRVKQPLRKMR